jgi:hypothetical protein
MIKSLFMPVSRVVSARRKTRDTGFIPAANETFMLLPPVPTAQRGFRVPVAVRAAALSPQGKRVVNAAWIGNPVCASGTEGRR